MGEIWTRDLRVGNEAIKAGVQVLIGRSRSAALD